MNLRILGLTKYEEEAYRAIVDLGKSSARIISNQAKVPYGRIYDTLQCLEKKELIISIPEKTRKYAANSPEKMCKLIEEKIKGLEELHKDVKNMQQIYELNEEHPISISEGRSNFHKMLSLIPDPKIYSYSIKHFAKYKAQYVDAYKKAKKRGVDVKVLTRYNEETKENIEKWMHLHKNIKKLNVENLAISISDDEYVMIGFIKRNMNLLIRNKEFAQLMKTMFLETYKNAEKINESAQ